MEVYLVQHGEAKPEAEDPQRSLTDKGRRDVSSMARHAAAIGMKASQIFHSGKLRAKQTAEIFAQRLSETPEAKETEGLSPLDDPQIARDLIEEAKEPLMIVGHLPHLSRLASSLIIGDPEREAIKFKMGGIVCLAKTERNWVANWILAPELIKE